MVSEPTMDSPFHVTVFQNPYQTLPKPLDQKTNSHKENMQWIKEALSYLLRAKFGGDIPLTIGIPVRTREELLGTVSESLPVIQTQSYEPPSEPKLLEEDQKSNPPLENIVEHVVCDPPILLEPLSMAQSEHQLYIVGKTYSNSSFKQTLRKKQISVQQCYHKARHKITKRSLWKEIQRLKRDTYLLHISQTGLENRLWNQWYHIGCVSNLLMCKKADRNRNESMIDTGWEQRSLTINNGFRLYFSLLSVIHVYLRTLESVRGMKDGDSKQAKISFQVSKEGFSMALCFEKNYLSNKVYTLKGDLCSVDIRIEENMDGVVEVGEELLKIRVSRVSFETGHYQTIPDHVTNGVVLQRYVKQARIPAVVDLVIDVARYENTVQGNMELEFQRNKERFSFPRRLVFNNQGILYLGSAVATNSRTIMIDGLRVVGLSVRVLWEQWYGSIKDDDQLSYGFPYTPPTTDSMVAGSWRVELAITTFHVFDSGGIQHVIGGKVIEIVREENVFRLSLQQCWYSLRKIKEVEAKTTSRRMGSIQSVRKSPYDDSTEEIKLIQRLDFSNWVENHVRERDFVVMKMRRFSYFGYKSQKQQLIFHGPLVQVLLNSKERNSIHTMEHEGSTLTLLGKSHDKWVKRGLASMRIEEVAIGAKELKFIVERFENYWIAILVSEYFHHPRPPDMFKRKECLELWVLVETTKQDDTASMSTKGECEKWHKEIKEVEAEVERLKKGGVSGRFGIEFVEDEFTYDDDVDSLQKSVSKVKLEQKGKRSITKQTNNKKGKKLKKVKQKLFDMGSKDDADRFLLFYGGQRKDTSNKDSLQSKVLWLCCFRLSYEDSMQVFSVSYPREQIISFNPLSLKSCLEVGLFRNVMQFLLMWEHSRLFPLGELVEFPDLALNSTSRELGGYNLFNWKGQVFSKIPNHMLIKRTRVGNPLQGHYGMYLLEYEYVPDDVERECNRRVRDWVNDGSHGEVGITRLVSFMEKVVFWKQTKNFLYAQASYQKVKTFMQNNLQVIDYGICMVMKTYILRTRCSLGGMY